MSQASSAPDLHRAARPTEEGDVFREHQSPGGRVHAPEQGAAALELESPAQHRTPQLGAADGAAAAQQTSGGGAAGAPQTGDGAAAAQLPGGDSRAGSHAAAVERHEAALLASGSRAEAFCGGVGEEGFGVGSTGLEAADPGEFGGLQVTWAAEGTRWALRAKSAPSLVTTSAPNARKVGARAPKPGAGVCRSRRVWKASCHCRGLNVARHA